MPGDKKARNIFSLLSGLAFKTLFVRSQAWPPSGVSPLRIPPAQHSHPPLLESHTASSCPSETLVKHHAMGNLQQFVSFPCPTRSPGLSCTSPFPPELAGSGSEAVAGDSTLSN